MKSLTLSRNVKIEKYEVLVEIARQYKREELIAVLKLAQEKGGRVTASDICESLLIGRPESVGRALLSRCHYLDLLDERGRLNEIGEKALETSSIFLPERARFRMWFTEDPLLPQKLLHLQPTDETLTYDDIRNDRNGQVGNSQNDQTSELPDKLRILEGREVNLLGRDGGLVVVRKIASYCLVKNISSEDNLTLTLCIEAQGPSSLVIDGKFKRALRAPTIEFECAWSELLGPLKDCWDNSRTPPALLTSFSELKDVELSSFRKTVHISKPELDGLGVFEDTSVDDVPITPRTNDDATEWAEWLLTRSIETYTTTEEFQEKRKLVKETFPDYPSLQLPSSEDLVGKLWNFRDDRGKLPHQYWYLRAPMDLKENKIFEKSERV
jgi:hypothetical protein